MAIYHLSAKVFSRSQGQSVVASAAYRASEKLYDERIGKTFDYTRKQEVLHTEILTPENATSWSTDREKLWNEVEAKERRKDSQLAREVEVALPRELTLEENVDLIRSFSEKNFISHGMVADIAIHNSDSADGEKNPHAHIMLTMREINKEGFQKKNREWNSTDTLESWRKEWQDSTNDFLAKKNIDQRIDHRSLEAQGIDREATIHIGVDASAMEKRGIETDRGNRQREINHFNRVLAHMKSIVTWAKQTPMQIYNRIKDHIPTVEQSRHNELELER